MNVDHYTYRVRWSGDDESYLGTAAEFKSLSWLADDPVEALIGIRALVADVVVDMQETGEEIPDAFADRPFSGNFPVRTSSEMHRQLVIDAAEQSVSLNRLVVTRLQSNQPSANRLVGA